MTTATREGNCVRHTGERFVGLHAGFTRLAWLMETDGDERGVRVELPDGTIKIASEHNLVSVEPAVYVTYAARLGVTLRGGKVPTRSNRT